MNAVSKKSPWAKTALTIAGLVGLCAIARLLPHPPNYTPVAATALFAGAMLKSRWVALCVPFLGMALSDALIGMYDVRQMACVYVGLSLPVFFRTWLQGPYPAARVLGCAAASSLFFFTLSNFAVWGFGSIFPHTFGGLVECYTVALPFLQFTLMGDLAWSGTLFGGYALLSQAAGLEGLHSTSQRAIPAMQLQAS